MSAVKAFDFEYVIVFGVSSMSHANDFLVRESFKAMRLKASTSEHQRIPTVDLREGKFDSKSRPVLFKTEWML